MLSLEELLPVGPGSEEPRSEMSAVSSEGEKFIMASNTSSKMAVSVVFSKLSR